MDVQNIKSQYRPTDKIPYNQAYSPTNFNTSLTVPEIDVFRKRLIENIADLNLAKHKFRTDEFLNLMNYFQYALNILNNIVNIRKVEYSNPYNANLRAVTGGTAQPGFDTINPYEDHMKVIYNRDGTTQIISTNDYQKKYSAEWNSQFEENLINPPSYTIPPSQCWNLPQKK